VEKASLIGAMIGFAVLGFVIATKADADWGVGVGVLGYVCFMLGWGLGWSSAQDRR
jgi:hypothetical protein